MVISKAGSGRLALWAAPVLVAIVVVANAWPGLMPGVGFWDTGEFQTVLPILGTAHPTGYPTYVLLGFVANLLLAPLGEPAFRVNLLSLLAVGVAAAATVTLVRRLTSSTPVAIATGLGLALTPVVWANATRADPHPIHLAFVALLLLVLVTWEQKRRAGASDADRWLVAAAIVFGLAAGNHSLTLLLAPPIALFVLATEPRIVFRGRLLGLCALALVGVVAAVYLELPLRAGLLRAPLVYGHPETWDGFWYVALAEQFRGSLLDPLGDLPHKIATLGDLAWRQLGPLALLILPAFLVTARRAPRYALLTGLAMVVTLIFNTSYVNADIQRYYLGPVLWVWTWLGVFAATVVEGVVALIPGAEAYRPLAPDARPGGRLSPSLATLLAAAAGVAILLPGIATSNASRLQADRSHDTGASLWLAEAMPIFAPNAIVVSWWSTSTPLWYGQKVEGIRPDISIVDDRTMLDQNLGGALQVLDRFLGVQPVYIIRANGSDLGEVLARFDLHQVAGEGTTAIYEVVARRTATR
jgi:4-amino-4-deoxy-L-arabinose transferase-like glycosyltransferase